MHEFSMTDFAARRVMMVDTQVRPSDVTKFPIIAAMLAVPREEFVPEARREAAYVGGNLDLAPGRVMLEARTLAKMLDALDIQPGERVLDLGAGLGYGAAVIARMAGRVDAVESDAGLADLARVRLAEQGVHNAVLRHGALAAKGAAGAFDVIVIEGGVEVVPASVTEQLAEGGRIAAIFMEGALGTVKIGTHEAGRITWRYAFNATAPILAEFATPKGFTF